MQYRLNPRPVAKWRRRTTTADAPIGPRQRRSTVPTPFEEAVVVAFRRRTLLPLDGMLGRLRETLPRRSRSVMRRCLQRHGTSRLARDPERSSPRGGIIFVEASRYRRGLTAATRSHLVDRVCRAHGIVHELTKPYHPWTNGHAERMIRTVREATVRTFHYDTHVARGTHLSAFATAYDFARHLKGLRWRTPFQASCDAWARDPAPFKLNPRHLIPGPNT